MSDVVNKLWGFCHTLRHDEIDYGDYVEQLTYLLFLKMSDERGIDLSRVEYVENKEKVVIDCTWKPFTEVSGTELIDSCAQIMRALSRQSGLLGDIFTQAMPRFTNPVNLKKVIIMIDEVDWSSMEVDVKGYIVLIDDEDLEKFSKYKWRINNGRGPYVVCSIWINLKTTKMLLHRYLIDAPVGKKVDHINHNTLDNRKCNLRICSSAENSQNNTKNNKIKTSSKYKGVSKRNDHWRASIKSNNIYHFLGCYGTEEEAAHAYNIAAQEFNGEFASLNILPDSYDSNVLPIKNNQRIYGQTKYVYFKPLKNRWCGAVYTKTKVYYTKYCKTEEEAIVAQKELAESLRIEQETGRKGL